MITISSDLKDFLEDNKDLINSNRWEDLYLKVSRTLPTENFTKIFLNPSVNINPLLYMKLVPSYFAYGLKDIKEIDIPEGITLIGESAFEGSSIESINLPNSLLIIGMNSFKLCPLETVVIPEKVSYIDTATFKLCPNLKYVDAGKNLIRIENNTFYGCSNLSEVILGERVTLIGTQSFAKCTSLKNIKLPSSLRTISDNVFSWCSSLQSIDILKGLTYIGQEAFSICKSLKSIELPSTLKMIGPYAFTGCDKLSEVTYRGLKSLFELVSRGYKSFPMDLKNILCKDGDFKIH